jgi:multimeric flavodoxin WrbA
MLKLEVLGISGSPRKGNSEYLLQQALDAAVEYAPTRVNSEAYSFRNKKFEPCLACNYCVRNNGLCIHKDDFNDLREKWFSADIILYSLPVYHMSMPGQVKCFIDRLGNSCFGSHRVDLPNGSVTLAKHMKVIGTIAQGIHIFSGQEHTITDMINHTLLMQSIPVNGDMWEAYIGAGGWTRNREGKDAMKQLNEEGELSASAAVAASRSLARRCVETADITLNGLLACREQLGLNPVYAQLYKTLDNKIDNESRDSDG